MQVINLIRIILEWPKEKQDGGEWRMVLLWIFDNNFLNLLLWLQASQDNLWSYETDQEILSLLSQKRPISNHCILYGLFSSHNDIKSFVLNIFNSLHPDQRSYQISYRVICSLGLYPKLSSAHQLENVSAAIGSRDLISNAVVAALISGLQIGTCISITRTWLEIPPGMVRGFRRWVILERQILENALEGWNSYIPRQLSTLELLLEMEQEKISTQTLYHLLTGIALSVRGKQSIMSALDLYYQVDPTPLTRFL